MVCMKCRGTGLADPDTELCDLCEGYGDPKIMQGIRKRIKDAVKAVDRRREQADAAAPQPFRIQDYAQKP